MKMETSSFKFEKMNLLKAGLLLTTFAVISRLAFYLATMQQVMPECQQVNNITVSYMDSIEIDRSNGTKQESSGDYLSRNETFIQIFSFGEPRTATTLQFNVICKCLFLQLLATDEKLTKQMSCFYSKTPIFESTKAQVIKSHKTSDDVIRTFNRSTTLLFTTARTKSEAMDRHTNLTDLGYTAGFVQDLETLKEIKSEGMVKKYAAAFDLTTNQTTLLLEYYELWDILRVCCGLQMSKYWRNDLSPPSKQKKNMTKHPTCDMYNIDVVERKFMNTKLFEMINKYEGLKSTNKPALVDGDLTGSYCSTYNDQVRKYGLKFNQRPH